MFFPSDEVEKKIDEKVVSVYPLRSSSTKPVRQIANLTNSKPPISDFPSTTSKNNWDTHPCVSSTLTEQSTSKTISST